MKNVVLMTATGVIALFMLASPTGVSAQVTPLDSPRPIAVLDTVVIEEMTWMEVRDAVAAGKTTAIVASGGIEEAGPYVANAKHNYNIRRDSEAIARRVGNALAAPIIPMSPVDTTIEEDDGLYPGTFHLRADTYKQYVIDVCASLKRHGFKNIFLYTDNAASRNALTETAKLLTDKWAKEPNPVKVYYIHEYRIQHEVIDKQVLPSLGIIEKGGTRGEGVHSSYRIEAILLWMDPTLVRFDQRVAAGKTSINGASLLPKEKTMEIGRKLFDVKVNGAVDAIKKILATNK
jgi:creatinine amidohydrolase